MTNLCEEYILSRSVEEAVYSLSKADGKAHLVAGGSDLLLELRRVFIRR